MERKWVVTVALALAGSLSAPFIQFARASEKLVRSPLAVVESVKKNASAAKAGVREGDLIIELDGKKRPSLQDVLAFRFDRESAQSAALKLNRAGEKLQVVFPQGDWGLKLRPDFSGEALARLASARQAAKKEEAPADAIGDWRSFATDLERAGFPDAACWASLEHGEDLRGRRRGKEAISVFEAIADKAPTGSFWSFLAVLKMADSLAAAGENERAAESFARAKKLAESGGSELRVAWALANWTKFEFGRGKLAEAKSLAQQSLAIQERLVPDSLDTAAGFNILAGVLFGQGDLAGARDYYLKSLKIRERLSPDSLAVAMSLLNLGNVLLRKGDLAEAHEHYSGALAIQERLSPDSLAVATCLNNLGNVAEERGDLEAATGYFQRALAIQNRLAPGGRDAAESLINLGVAAMHRGDLSSARESYMRSLEINEKLAPGSLRVARCFNNLGIVAAMQGDLAAAAEFLRKSLALIEANAPDSLDVATGYSNLGGVARDLSDLEAAREYHLKALAIREKLAPDGLDTASSLHNLGMVSADLGDAASAKEYFAKALAIRERLAPESLLVASVLESLGSVSVKSGDLAGGKQLHGKALEIRRRSAPGSLQEALSLANIAGAEALLGDSAAASDYKKAIAIQESLAPGSLALAESLRGLAKSERASGNLPGCTGLLSRAVDELEAQRGMAGGESAKTSFFSAHSDFYTDLIAAYLDSGKPESAMETLERSRAKALLEIISSRWVDLGGEIPEPLLKRQRELARQRKDLFDKLSEADEKTDPAELGAWRAELLLLPQKEDALAGEIRKASPRLAALEYPAPLDFKGIVEALDPGSLLLAFAVAEEETFVFSIQAGASRAGFAGDGSRAVGRGGSPPTKAGRDTQRLRAVRLPVGKKAIENRVRAFRAQLGPDAASENSKAWRKTASSLYEALLGPASKEIASCERLILIPDGPLHQLPFGALLPRGEKAPALGLQKPISIIPSVTVYEELKGVGSQESGQAVKQTWTGFGDPSYLNDRKARGATEEEASPTRGASLAPLPGTRREIEAISALFGAGAKPLTGADATEEAVRALPGGSRFLHFACHGLVDQMFPMNSALALSASQAGDAKGGDPAGDNRADGLLQAWEIIQDLKLQSDCVVLSACETGTGKIMAGEGIMGLTRAFFYAGARSVVVSLWAVSDESTARLMEAFYREIREGVPRDEALRRAMLRLSSSRDRARSPSSARQPDYSHPFYWAAFELHGRAD